MKILIIVLSIIVFFIGMSIPYIQQRYVLWNTVEDYCEHGGTPLKIGNENYACTWRNPTKPSFVGLSEI